MAFAFVKSKDFHIGGTRVASGYYTNSSSTGGTINTGLAQVTSIILTGGTSTTAPYYTTTLPSIAANGAITIVTANNDSGSWEAIGV